MRKINLLITCVGGELIPELINLEQILLPMKPCEPITIIFMITV